ncbi:MAG: mycothiol synthase [Actinomycetales bacterium]|nr:mycothiol synthase [Actinomycetales bacterium]
MAITPSVVHGALPEDVVPLVYGLVEDAEQADGIAPLSEQRLLWLGDADAPVVHLLTWAPGRLTGIAQLDLGVDGKATAELAVAPSDRRQGLGEVLLRGARKEAGDREFAVWAHGDLPGAKALAMGSGLRPARELWIMRVDLVARPQVEIRALPEGVTVRTFVVGQDEDAWLRVNARAFADHPEQGRISLADLEAREAEPWFDAESFFLAERDGELLASVWLKVVDGIGEIYVLGVDPDAQGLVLGSALTARALERFDQLGLGVAILYTSASNLAAVRTYAKFGFAPSNVDVTYA